MVIRITRSDHSCSPLYILRDLHSALGPVYISCTLDRFRRTYL